MAIGVSVSRRTISRHSGRVPWFHVTERNGRRNDCGANNKSVQSVRSEFKQTTWPMIRWMLHYGGQKMYARIKSDYPLAVFVNCSAHRLYLVVNDLNAVSDVRNTIGTVKPSRNFSERA